MLQNLRNGLQETTFISDIIVGFKGSPRPCLLLTPNANLGIPN